MLRSKDVMEKRKSLLISNYFYIPVGDLEKADSWYEKILDFNVIHRDSLYFDMRTDKLFILFILSPKM